MDVCGKIIDACFDGLAGIKGSLAIDYNVGTGDFLTAWIIRAVSMNIPCFYMGLSADSSYADWVRGTSLMSCPTWFSTRLWSSLVFSFLHLLRLLRRHPRPRSSRSWCLM